MIGDERQELPKIGNVTPTLRQPMEGFAQQLASLKRAASRVAVLADESKSTQDQGVVGESRRNDGGDHGRRADRDRGGQRKRRRYDDNNSNNDNDTNLSHSKRGLFCTLINQVAEQYQKDCSSVPNLASHPQRHQQRHVALLFITLDDLPHEHIWRMWLRSYFTSSTNYGTPTNASNNDSNHNSSQQQQQQKLRISVLVHAKYPERIKSTWLKQHHLLRLPSTRLSLQQHQCRNNRVEDGSSIDNRRKENETNISSTENDSLTPATNATSTTFHTHRPEWGSIEITKAMIDLLQVGLRIGKDDETSLGRGCDNETDLIFVNDVNNDSTDESDGIVSPVDRFIFVSESCLPVVTLAELEMALFGPGTDVETGRYNIYPSSCSEYNKVATSYDKSWVNAISSPNNGYALQYQWNAILAANKNNNLDDSCIPIDHIWKADQWVMLTRAHAAAIVSLPDKYLGGRQLLNEFRKCRASDEMYIPTALSILGILHRPRYGIQKVLMDDRESCAGQTIRRRKMTYVDWSMSAKNPASFTCRDWKEVVEKARKEGCLFARKFVRLTSTMSMKFGDSKQRQILERDSPLNSKTSSNDGFDGLVSVEAWMSAVVGRNK